MQYGLQVSDSDSIFDWLSKQKPEKTVEGGQCSTLFIANLGPNCTEDELKQVLSE